MGIAGRSCWRYQANTRWPNLRVSDEAPATANCFAVKNFAAADCMAGESVEGIDGGIDGVVDGAIDGLIDGVIDGVVDGVVDGVIDGHQLRGGNGCRVVVHVSTWHVFL